MPSFDITSEFNEQEVVNAIDQTKRELSTRYDFKNTNTTINKNDSLITLKSSTQERLNASIQVIKEKFTKRNVSIKFLNDFKEETTPSEVKIIYDLKSGINQEESKKIIFLIKDFNKKTQCSFQNESIRVTSKKRDELQDIITFLKESKIDLPISFGNFRD